MVRSMFLFLSLTKSSCIKYGKATQPYGGIGLLDDVEM